MGRTTKTTGPDGSSTRFEYDAKGRQTKTIYSDDTYSETTYDIYGNTKTTRDRAGRITEFFYDRLNRTVKIKDPAGNYTYYQYDANGNRTAVRDPRSSGAADDTYKTSYTYDLNNRLTRIDYPDGTFETTTYDPNGNTLTKTDQKNQIVSYEYDNANRLIKIVYADSTTTEYNFDVEEISLYKKNFDGSRVYIEAFGNESREYLVDASGKLIYDYVTLYDENGNLWKFMDCTEANIVKYNNVMYNESVNKVGYSSTAILGRNFKYGRESEDGVAHRLYRQGVPDSRIKWGNVKFGSGGINYGSISGVLTQTFSYDDNYNLTKLTDPWGGEYKFEMFGKTMQTRYPNGVITEKTVNDEGSLDTIIHKRCESDGSNTILESYSYIYENSGNITKIIMNNGEYMEYTYDNLNQLTSEERKTLTGTRIYKIDYKFDDNQAKNGNIRQVIVNETQVTTYTYNKMNQLIEITNPDASTEILTYDDNGNLIRSSKNGETTDYIWNCNNRLTKIILPNGGITEFSYDSSGMLVKHVSDGIERKYIQRNHFANREMVKNVKGEWETSAIHTIHGSMLGTRINSTSIYPDSKTDSIFYHTDHLGSVRLITDKNGNIIDSIFTDAYGNPFPREAAVPEASIGSKVSREAKILQEFNFVGTHGIRYIEKIRLYNMRARFYRNSDYRFISRDIYNFINRYVYANLNPLILIDATGMNVTFTQADINHNRGLNWQLPISRTSEVIDMNDYSPSGQLDGNGKPVYHWHGYGYHGFWARGRDNRLFLSQIFHYGIDQRVNQRNYNSQQVNYNSFNIAHSPVNGRILHVFSNPTINRFTFPPGYGNGYYWDRSVVMLTDDRFCWEEDGRHHSERIRILFQHFAGVDVRANQHIQRSQIMGRVGFYFWQMMDRGEEVIVQKPHIHFELRKDIERYDYADSLNLEGVFHQWS